MGTLRLSTTPTSAPNTLVVSHSTSSREIFDLVKEKGYTTLVLGEGVIRALKSNISDALGVFDEVEIEDVAILSKLQKEESKLDHKALLLIFLEAKKRSNRKIDFVREFLPKALKESHESGFSPDDDFGALKKQKPNAQRNLESPLTDNARKKLSELIRRYEKRNLK